MKTRTANPRPFTPLGLPSIRHEFDPRFKVFHELMQNKVKDILLVSTLYDACLMEEEGRLSERIIHEYKGLNLSKPPRLSWVSSAEEALTLLDSHHFDLVITMQRLADMDASGLGRAIKQKIPHLPVILLTHAAFLPDCSVKPQGIDRIFVWFGNADLLLAQIKSVEDQINVEHDTWSAGVRVILFVEDSPIYLSSFLPILYHEVVAQTQGVIEERLNDEDRLLTMRARSKILIAETYEEAIRIIEKYQPFLLGVVSDTRFPRDGRFDENAGLALIHRLRSEIPDIPMALTSSEPANRLKAVQTGVEFIDKNSPTLHSDIQSFLLNYLGFGDFVFRLRDRSEVARISTCRTMEKILPDIPDESLLYHARRNDFSRWLFARAEIVLASQLRPATVSDFEGNAAAIREFLISSMKARRRMRQKGVIVDFEAMDFDPDTDVMKIGKGSLGGKARGLAFLSTLLERDPGLSAKYPDIELIVPQSLILTTEGFDEFIASNHLAGLAGQDLTDSKIAEAFKRAAFPNRWTKLLRTYLGQVHHPLAVRSSGLLEDAQFRAYAGLYRTYMLPNDDPDLVVRLEQLIQAIKLVYASTYFQGPRAYSKRVGQRTEEEKMAVVVQQLIGTTQGQYFYPAISGVAQSHNYYPIGRVTPEDGMATIAMGLGKTVVSGEKALRFSPRHPQFLPQFSTVEDILANAQKNFYALRMGEKDLVLDHQEDSTLAQRAVSEAVSEKPMEMVSSSYIPEEHRLRDTGRGPGHRVITFAQILKHKAFPLADILVDVMKRLREGMGAPVELEFSVHLCPEAGAKPVFALLQVRPMTTRTELREIDISEHEIQKAFCTSTQALGNGDFREMEDIILVKPQAFDPAQTVKIAQEIGRFNGLLTMEKRPYMLIGPGRWGSADRWLGIPVAWTDISGVGAIVETSLPQLKAEPSQGSHFFHNVTTMGITYLTVTEKSPDFIDWAWLESRPVVGESPFVAHLRLDSPMVLKVDGRKSMGVAYPGSGEFEQDGNHLTQATCNSS